MNRPLMGGAAMCLFALSVAQCTKARTEMVVTVWSELGWGTGRDLQSLAVTVRRDNANGVIRGHRTNLLGTESGQWRFPLSFGLFPADTDDTAPVWFEVLGCSAGAECVASNALVTQRAIVTYRPGGIVGLDIWLPARCRGVLCPVSDTCARETGLCVPAWLRDLDVLPLPSGLLSSGQRSCAAPAPSGCGLVPVTGASSFDVGARADCSASPSDSQCAYNASPPQRVGVGSFAIDAHEVSVGRFRRFWTSGGARPTFPVAGTYIPYPNGDIIWDSSWVPQEPSTSGACTWITGPDDRPINCVDWYTALAFCVWDGGRLPTQAEWELAARGTNGRLYPWGSAAPTSTGPACWSRLSPTPTAACSMGRYSPAGDTPDGIHDLAGNVFEWNADTYQDYGSGCWAGSGQQNPLCNASVTGHRVLRGGSWDIDDAGILRSASRGLNNPAVRYDGYGFRCARTR